MSIKNKTQKKTNAGKAKKGQAAKKAVNNKKTDGKSIKLLFALTLAIIAIAVIAAALSGNAGQYTGEKINIYFLNETAKKLEPESRIIQYGDDVEIVKSVLNELIAGPKSATLSRTIPEDVIIKEVKLPKNSNVAEVQFSENYNDMAINDELFCRVSLVWTLTELHFIDDIHIFVGEEELLKSNGEPIGLLNRENVSIASEIPPYPLKEEPYKIYFADEQGLGLVPEERMIEVGSNQTAEKSIVEQIIKGPSSQGLVRTVPPDTKINDVRTDESICYVDLSADFINKFEGGSTAERLAVYSIVNSLTELPYIKKVQFFIDGSKVSDIKGHLMDISAPFESNKDLILNQ